MEILSLWRSPLDKVALSEAEALHGRQPRCSSIGFDENFAAMTIFNYGQYIAGTSPTPGDPNAALTDMFEAMSTASTPPYNSSIVGAVGGTAFIPQAQFAVVASPSGFTVPIQSNIVGSGTGGDATASAPASYHFIIYGSGDPLCFLYASGSHTSGGTYFRGLAFNWTGATTGSETCIYANTWNCQAIDCNFFDCPVAFNAQGLQCGMVRCTVYSANVPAPTINTPQSSYPAVILAGPQSFVIGPGEHFQPYPGSEGPLGLSWVSIQNVEHLMIRECHVYNWSYGINYSIGNNSSTIAANVSFVEAECYSNCVYMQLANGDARISAQKYTSCTFSLATGTGSPNPVNPTISSLFVIDTNGFSNNNLEDIELNNCSIFQSNLHGLEIVGGQNLRIIGGQYSGNGPSGGAGIAITGNCGDVTIVGANLRADYSNQRIPQSQQWAFLISSSPMGKIIVDSCAMENYGMASPISVTGSPAALYVTNCPGYNDQNTPLTPSSWTSNQHAAGLGYYGPSVLTWFGGGSFYLNGVSFMSPGFGSIYLAPYDVIKFMASPTMVAWVGK